MAHTPVGACGHGPSMSCSASKSAVPAVPPEKISVITTAWVKLGITNSRAYQRHSPLDVTGDTVCPRPEGQHGAPMSQ
jgi:hypothetical protein